MSALGCWQREGIRGRKREGGSERRKLEGGSEREAASIADVKAQQDRNHKPDDEGKRPSPKRNQRLRA